MKTTLVPKKCPWCGNFFNPKTAWSVFCSHDCLKQSDRKKGKERREKERLKRIAATIADDQAYLTVRQAVAIFAVNRITLYTHIRHGKIPVVRIKERGIRIKRTELESRYLTREKQAHPDPLPLRVKLYNLEPENCYTIGEATEKFKVEVPLYIIMYASTAYQCARLADMYIYLTKKLTEYLRTDEEIIT